LLMRAPVTGRTQILAGLRGKTMAGGDDGIAG
jgi:hypothetical protein